jgi:solute:Na+ symporter, SSS family
MGISGSTVDGAGLGVKSLLRPRPLPYRAPLQPLDLVLVAAYLAGVIAVGAWFSRRQRTTSQYFLGNRRVPWWAVAASIVATETSAITFISIPGIAYSRGGDLAFLQVAAGYVVGRVVISRLLLPSYFQGELLSVYQLLSARFGAAVKALTASLFVVMRTGADGIRLLVTAIVLAAVARAMNPGADPDALVVAAAGALGVAMILFTLWGGIEAVIWIEVVQLAIYLAGAIAAALVLVGKIPGGFAAALESAAAHGKLRVVDASFDLARPYTIGSGLIGGAFLTMATHGTDQYFVQRYLCTGSPRKAAAALLSSGVFVFVQFAGFLAIGVLLFAFYRPFEAAGASGGAPAAPFGAPDQVFPAFITQEMPSGLAGLVVAAILAAAMSSSLNSIAATAVSDLYRPVARGRSDAHYLRVGKGLTVVVGVLQVGVALALRHSQRSALDSALLVASILNGPVLGVFLIGALTRRAGPAAALAGMAAGAAASISIWIAAPVEWPWYAAIGSLTTLAVGVTAGKVIAWAAARSSPSRSSSSSARSSAREGAAGEGPGRR